MSKIRLYQRRGEKGQGHLQDLNSPPRFTIRRRMIAGLVKMATSGYDRWYIMAHSLGAIVAFNGLSEPENSLVNYLDEATWELARDKNLHEPEAQQSDDFIKSRMKPSRPPWLKGSDRIYRHKLFKDLHGLVTYGGPFRHFVDLWPGIMLCHNERKDFNGKFKWFNIYDPSDPVASVAEAMIPADHEGIKPIDIPYKAPYYHLLSHVSYLNIDKKSNDALVDRLLSWMRDEIPLDLSRSTVEESSESPMWRWTKKGIKRHRVLRFLIWWFLGYIGALFISFFPIILVILLNTLRSLLHDPNLNPSIIKKLFENLSLFNYLFILGGGVVVLAIGLAFVMGIGRRYILGMILGKNQPELRIKEFLEDQANRSFTVKEISSYFDYTEEIISNIIHKLSEKKVIRCEEDKYVFPSYEIIMSSDACKQLRKILKEYQGDCPINSCNHNFQKSKDRPNGANLVKDLESVLKEIAFEPKIEQDKSVNNNKITTVKICEQRQISYWLLVIKNVSNNNYINYMWFIQYGIIHRAERYRDPMIFIIKIERNSVQK